MRFFLTAILLLIVNRASASELFSVRCEGVRPATPYFATFDTDAKTVVFESQPANVTSYDGANVFAGEITPSGDRPDGRIEFTIRVVGGKLSLTFDVGSKRMIWPGFNDAPSHTCTVTAPRSILSFRTPAPILHPISIRCSEAGYMYFTMDPESKRALYERDGGGSYEGEVTAVRGDEIDLRLERTTPGQYLWSRSRQTVTFEGIDGKKGTPKSCEEIAPRTMIEYHKRKR